MLESDTVTIENVIDKFQSQNLQKNAESTLKGHIVLHETKGDKEILLILSASVESGKISDIEKRILCVFSVPYHIMATQRILLLISSCLCPWTFVHNHSTSFLEANNQYLLCIKRFWSR